MLAFYATMLVDSLKLLVISRGEEHATEVWLTHNFRSFSFPDLSPASTGVDSSESSEITSGSSSDYMQHFFPP